MPTVPTFTALLFPTARPSKGRDDSPSPANFTLMMIQLLTPATAATKAVTFLTAGQMISQLANLSSELSQKSLLSFERLDLGFTYWVGQ